jgi:hypothetical protein
MLAPNPHLDWGLSTYDVRNSAVINAIYELPFGRGKKFGAKTNGVLDKFIGGWSLSGIGTFQPGFPFTPQLGFNPSNDGNSRNAVRPSWNPAFQSPVITGNPNQWFNANEFILPQAGTYGNVGRDTLVGPGMTDVDFATLKSTTLSERVTLQFRAEFFNILNHANFNTPNTVVFTSATSGISPTAGVITSTSTTSRQTQFGLKLIW